jgi:hypothetical protein
MGTKKTTTTPAAVKVATTTAIPATTETKVLLYQYGKRNGETCITATFECDATFQGELDKKRLAHYIARKVYTLTQLTEQTKAAGVPVAGFSTTKPLEFKVVGTGISSFGTIRNAFGAYIKGKRGGAILTREQLALLVNYILGVIDVQREDTEI